MDEKKLLFIVNPRAGKTRTNAPLYDAIAQYGEAGYAVRLMRTAGRGDATRFAAEMGADYDLIVCCGGDGTLNETVNGAMQIPSDKRPPMSYLPRGSTNDFAASIGISSDPAKAAEKAMQSKVYTLDIGLFNERYFTYVASFGAFSRTSYSVPQDIKNALGHLAYILECGKDLDTLRPYQMTVETENETFSGNYFFGAICNSTSIAGLMKLPPSVVDFSDGEFELLLVPVPENPAETQSLLHTLITQDIQNSKSVILRHVHSVTVRSGQPTPWTVDGEYAGDDDVIRISVVSGEVQMLF